MANLFSIKSPLLVRYPNGEQHVVAELFQHAQGIVYFVPWWLAVEPPGVYLVEGEVRGEGPWKIGDVIVRLMSCGDSDDSMYWAQWQQYLSGCEPDNPYLDEQARHALATKAGRKL